MLMLDKANEVSREELQAIPTPSPTETWRPIAHAEVVEVLVERARFWGLTVRNERYAVMDGALYPSEGEKRELPGARLFGSLDFEPVPGMKFPEGCTPSAGFRNSHDKSFALSILSGARVLVCANGVLSAEYIVSRKHTVGINLHYEIDRALDAFMQSIGSFQLQHERLQNTSLSLHKAHSLVIEMARAGAISSSQILPVVREYEEPSHPEFRERNAWCLYQATTEVMKAQSPARQVDGFRALNTVIQPLLN